MLADIAILDREPSGMWIPFGEATVRLLMDDLESEGLVDYYFDDIHSEMRAIGVRFFSPGGTFVNHLISWLNYPYRLNTGREESFIYNKVSEYVHEKLEQLRERLVDIYDDGRHEVEISGKMVSMFSRLAEEGYIISLWSQRMDRKGQQLFAKYSRLDRICIIENYIPVGGFEGFQQLFDFRPEETVVMTASAADAQSFENIGLKPVVFENGTPASCDVADPLLCGILKDIWK